MQNTNPYSSLEKTKFWREALNDFTREGEFTGIWKPKFPLNKNTKFITLGSCFAQHISRWLLEHDYHWLEGETPPPGLSDEDRKQAGFGVFSFLTGNIYTVALLRQWLRLASDRSFCIDEVFIEDDRYFDPLRPGIPSAGFTSREALMQSRASTCDAINSTIRHTDVFIFTLGLTEAWLNRSGYVYPVCPGTVRGRFLAEQHLFKNFSYAEVVDDLLDCISMCKNLNPHIRFLFTVSPVPLTATASENHVLTATTYSKAVLRAAAGFLAATRDDVDYFPSFELVTTHLNNLQPFESNMRSVKKEGVDFVMKHFERAVQVGIAAQPINSAPAIVTTDGRKDQTDLICDDILLETWMNQDYRPDIDICLIGDSHMGKLSEGLKTLSVPHMGGMIMNGSAWTSNLLHLDTQEIFVPLEDAASRARWKQTLPFFSNTETRKYVVMNVCMQTHRSVSFMVDYINKNLGGVFNADNFLNYFMTVNKTKLDMLGKIGDRLDVTVFMLTDPPTQQRNPAWQANSDYLKLFEFYDLMVDAIYSQIGCHVINARKLFYSDKFNPLYYSDTVFADGSLDWYHGSSLYYADLGKELLRQIDALKNQAALG